MTRGHCEWWEGPRRIRLRERWRRNYSEASLGQILFSSSTPTWQRMILIPRKILLHSNYEGTDFEELARDIGFHPCGPD